jgi:hypothetical protein
VRGTWREGSLTGDPRGDAPFPGNLRGEIFLSGELLLGNPRDTKMKALEKGNSLHMGPVVVWKRWHTVKSLKSCGMLHHHLQVAYFVWIFLHRESEWREFF